MPIQIIFRKRPKLSKQDWAINLTPNIWVLHNSVESRVKFVESYNRSTKSNNKMMTAYTSFYLSWIVWNLIIKIGKYS